MIEEEDMSIALYDELKAYYFQPESPHIAVELPGDAPSNATSMSTSQAQNPDSGGSLTLRQNQSSESPAGFRCDHPGCTHPPFQTQYLLKYVSQHHHWLMSLEP